MNRVAEEDLLQSRGCIGVLDRPLCATFTGPYECCETCGHYARCHINPVCDTCHGTRFVEPVGGYEEGEPGDRCPTCNKKEGGE